MSSPEQRAPSPRIVETALSGYELLNDPLLNKGTGFSDAERDEFDLHGLLPPRVTPLDMQVKRRLDAFRGQTSDLHRYVFLRGLQDSNEILFYALLTQNIEEMMPVVYTPTVGLGCQLFSHIFRKPRGLFLSMPYKDAIRRILGHPRFDGVEAIVVSDGERILGLGDQGAGGMGIPIGKLSLYTACAGLHPSTTLPILLDVGTDNKERLADPLYVGWQHERVRGAEYDALIETFVDAVSERWPHVLLHWEDFALRNANRLLARYRDRLCTFNDDIQGTAAVAVGHAARRRQRHRRAAAQPAHGSARRRLRRDRHLRAAAARHDRSRRERARRAQPLLFGRPRWFAGRRHAGPAAVPGAVRAAARRVADWKLQNHRPHRTRRRRCQCTAHGADRHVRTAAHLYRRHRARDGAPCRRPDHFSAVEPDGAQRGDAARSSGLDRRPRRHRHRQPVSAASGATAAMFRVDQTNNAYVYPGIGLGAIAVQARAFPTAMFLAAARTVAELSPARRDPAANLLPPLIELREISFHVAIAVAKQAIAEGLAAPTTPEQIAAAVRAKMWEPVYARYRRLPAGKAK